MPMELTLGETGGGILENQDIVEEVPSSTESGQKRQPPLVLLGSCAAVGGVIALMFFAEKLF